MVSQGTKELFERRTKEFAKNKPSKERRQKWNRTIRNACRNDYRAWVSNWVEKIDQSDNAGDTKAIYQGVKALSGQGQKRGRAKPTKNKNGENLNGAQELAEAWKEFLDKKFSATELEQLREEFEALPQCKDEKEKITREEYNAAVQHMKNGKAPGIDGIPAEVWKNSKVANEVLFQFLQKIWSKEKVPLNLVVCVFIMIYKNKGSADDFTKYRAIGLLNHAYKIMAVVLLRRLVQECGHFFSE